MVLSAVLKEEEPTDTRSMSGMVVVARLLPGPSASMEMSTSGVRPDRSVLFDRLQTILNLVISIKK